MSDPYLLRDERGNPLTSVFHEPMRCDAFDALWHGISKMFSPIEDFHPDDYDEEVKEK